MPSQNGIRAIFYDLDGTLRFNQPSGRDFFADRAVELGLPISPADRLRSTRWEHHYWASSDEAHHDRLNFPDGKSFWQNYGIRQLQVLGASAEQAGTLGPQISEYMEEFYRPDDIMLPDTHATLSALRESGYILAVVSNRDEPFGEYLEKMGIGKYFHFSLAAGEVESWKPDRGIFEHALRRAGVEAREAIYVGDNYFADIVGARSAGLNPVLIDIQGVFEEPGCPVIQSHEQILPILERRIVWPGNGD
ncbi:MAG: HAD family hydrolase [Chloroflexi bacterium]|nr:MAG: HAD family hydrolase [Chloroflexota bacterium]